jgi:hypothetical protein
MFLHSDSKVQPFRQLAAKQFVAIGGRTKAVIQMAKSGDREFPVFGEITEQKEQRHRIGTARNRHQDMAARWAKRVALDGLSDALMQV